MKRIVPLLFGMCFLSLQARAAEPPCAWPRGAFAAVSLACDDALESQLDNAVAAGLKATST